MRKQKEPTWLMSLRILLACVFIFSGLSKAIDPVASGIQMSDYFTSFRMGFLYPFSFLSGFLMNIAEFTLGFMLLFRIRVRLTTLGYLLFMVFFFCLTLWLALAEHLEVNYGYNFGVVKDCGCFGKAIAMTNMGTFLKNVGLLIVTLIVFGKRKMIPDIKYTLLGQWTLALLGAVIAIIVQIYCVRSLPIVDFSDWKKGKDVVEIFVEKPAVMDMLFLYKNNEGVEKLLSIESFETITETEPNFYEKYSYIDRFDSVVVEAVPPVIPGFSMLDDLGKDHSANYLNPNKEKVYILFMHDLDEVSDKAMTSINLKNIVADCYKNKIDFVAITNSPFPEIEDFIKKYNITFPIFYHPIDPVKGPFMVRDAIRSNPGLIMLKNGIVEKKKGWRQF